VRTATPPQRRAAGAFFLAGLCATLLAPESHAQITFSNLLEVRIGHDPDDVISNVPENRLTRFDQFSIDYFRDRLNLGFRFETYLPSDDATLEYARFTQRYAAWSSPQVDLRVGNFQALLGRGLVLRAFELTGVVREEFGTPQFGDSRDLDGVRADARVDLLDLVLLSGQPRFADDPPDVERRGAVSGGQLGADLIDDVRAGVEYVRLDDPARTGSAPRTTEIGGGFVRVGFDPWLERAQLGWLSLDTYVEYAEASGVVGTAATSSDKLAPDQGRALYAMQNALVGPFQDVRLGLSWEYKDYQNFEFRVNEPPPLVREHTAVLLNRNTHVLDPVQEEGYQFESLVALAERATLLLNWSRAENKPLRVPAAPTQPALAYIPRRFREFYAEAAVDPAGGTVSAFVGESEDGLAGLDDARSWGAEARSPAWRSHSLEIDYEHLHANRVLAGDAYPFTDQYVAMEWAWAGRATVSLSRQTTDDPADAAGSTAAGAPRRTYDALTASVRLGNHNEIEGFWGKRREGLQCTAGTCYLVRAFDGVTLRLLTRF
jgi:hypothetical protein